MSGALFSVTAKITDAAGGEHVVSTSSWDIIVVERAVGKIRMLDGEPSVEETFRLVHSAAKRAGIAGDDFDAWLQEVEVDLVDDDPKAGSAQPPTWPLSSSNPVSPPTCWSG